MQLLLLFQLSNHTQYRREKPLNVTWILTLISFGLALAPGDDFIYTKTRPYPKASCLLHIWREVERNLCCLLSNQILRAQHLARSNTSDRSSAIGSPDSGFKLNGKWFYLSHVKRICLVSTPLELLRQYFHTSDTWVNIFYIFTASENYCSPLSWLQFQLGINNGGEGAGFWQKIFNLAYMNRKFTSAALQVLHRQGMKTLP